MRPPWSEDHIRVLLSALCASAVGLFVSSPTRLAPSPMLSGDNARYSGMMAARKMTFSLPEELAIRLTRRVPARDRSRYAAEAITRSLQEQEQRLVQACESANQDEDIAEIERDFDGLSAEGLDPRISGSPKTTFASWYDPQ